MLLSIFINQLLTLASNVVAEILARLLNDPKRILALLLAVCLVTFGESA